jgi:hypothetical protein
MSSTSPASHLRTGTRCCYINIRIQYFYYDYPIEDFPIEIENITFPCHSLPFFNSCLPGCSCDVADAPQAKNSPMTRLVLHHYMIIWRMIADPISFRCTPACAGRVLCSGSGGSPVIGVSKAWAMAELTSIKRRCFFADIHMAKHTIWSCSSNLNMVTKRVKILFLLNIAKVKDSWLIMRFSISSRLLLWSSKQLYPQFQFRRR